MPPAAGRGAVVPQEVGVAARYRTSEVARILGVSADRVRRMVRRGHCAPDRHGRAYRFAFQDLVFLRTAQRLLRGGGISPRRVHLALRQLQRQLPASTPLSGVRIHTVAGEIIVRDREAVWRPESGQQIFPFVVDGLPALSTMATQATRLGRLVQRPVQNAGDWFDYGVMIEQEDPNGARQAYERALEQDPDFSDAYLNLGRLVHEGGDPRGAAKFYAEALRRNPYDAVTHYNLAVACEDMDRLAKARDHYEQALAVNPNFADAHFNLGRILETAGESDAALKHLLAYRRLSEQR